MTTERVDSIRVVRKCPRCNRRQYQRATLYKDDAKLHAEASCTDCGHTWRIRVVKEEWDLP